MTRRVQAALGRPGARVRRLRRWRQTETGQTLVEFSLILPIFLLLLFALVDFGRGFYTWLLVTNAAREGARAAAVQMDSAGIDSKLYGSICDTWPSPTSCSLDTSLMSVSKTNVQGARGSQATVTVAFNFQFVTPMGNILSLITGSSLSAPTITSTSAMRLE